MRKRGCFMFFNVGCCRGMESLFSDSNQCPTKSKLTKPVAF